MSPIERAVAAPRALTRAEIASALSCEDAAFWREAFAASREVCAACGRDRVLMRGLIECSNVCAKDCLYCGIRRGRAGLPRYRLSEAAVADAVLRIRRCGWTAVAFQAGEVETEANVRYYERALARCDGLEVTLSLGEQTEEVYRRWRDAGALRYLIRIETSNRALFGKIHPPDHSFDRRLACIRTLKRLGYVTGSGVMIGLPGQTADDLARDIVFYGEENLDMVGMGPYIPTPGTPLAAAASGRSAPSRSRALELALRMIALTRLYLHDVNIVAATALEALAPGDGRERGIAAGANVVMTDVTPGEVQSDYALYPGKAEAK